MFEGIKNDPTPWSEVAKNVTIGLFLITIILLSLPFNIPMSVVAASTFVFTAHVSLKLTIGAMALWAWSWAIEGIVGQYAQ